MSGDIQRHAPAEGTARVLLRSDVVIAGALAWLNGVGPRNLENDRTFLPDGMEGQAQQILANLETLLARCGSGLDGLVSVRVHLVDFERFEERFRHVWAKRFRDLPKPSMSVIGVEALPRGALVELDAVARVGG